MLIELRDAGSGLPTPPVEPGRTVPANRPPPSRDDRELVALVVRARAADLEAQAELVRRYRARLAGYVRAMSPSSDGVEDIVQIAFLKMVRRLGALRDPRGFETWLFTLARNTALDSRRRARCRPITVEPEADGPELADVTLTDRSRDILEAIEVVTRDWDGHSRRMLGHLMEGTGYGTIARQEGLTVGAIKLRLHRLRQRLRRNLPIALGDVPGRLSMA